MALGDGERIDLRPSWVPTIGMSILAFGVAAVGMQVFTGQLSIPATMGALGLVLGAAASRWARMGGELTWTRADVLLDGHPVTALVDWNIEGGWLALTLDGSPEPDVRCGPPEAVRQGVARLRDAQWIGVDLAEPEIHERLDGVELGCQPVSPRLGLLDTLLAAAVPFGIGTMIIVSSVSFTSVLDVLSLGILLVGGALVAFPAVALPVWALLHWTSGNPAVEAQLAGRKLTLTAGGRTVEVIVGDPARQVQVESARRGCWMRVFDVDGAPLCRVAVTRPFVDALTRRLARLDAESFGSAAEIPQCIGRLRQPESAGSA